MAWDPVQIGRYKILGTLGQGAMGTVHLAEDPTLKRGLAIKVVRGGRGDAEVMARFRREAEISARLNHPNLITIFDVGEDPELGPFLAMELVEGETLDALASAGPMSPAEAVPLLLQAGQALEAIHAAGIVHRDVKPANFMVAKDGRLKLMDFGIARGDEPRLTTTSAFLGTPAYAAPESLSGTGRPTEASDRWALAVTAFELLTGRLPFEAESLNAVLYRVAHEPPAFPEALSPALQAVFTKALSKEPGARYPTIRAFLRALVDALPLDPGDLAAARAQLESPAALSGMRRNRFRRRFRVSRRGWIAAGAALAAGIAVLAFVFWPSQARVLAIYSTPSGAEVFLDGTGLGRTPLPQVVVSGRARKLRFEKPEYLPAEVSIPPGEDRVEARLVPAPWRVRVETEPAGAEVWLDGARAGTAPVTLQVPGAGRHTLELRAPGYEPLTLPLRRGQAVPSPIRLRRPGAAEPKDRAGKVKRFLKDLLDK
ncbi:MAG TPA: serine/threonine-protein kinase [Holophagaceae bacterium]|nr:serine/threonine-protein kinase [Holophagaceae bacterium]